MLRTLEVERELGIKRQLHYVDIPEPADEAYWDGMLAIYRETVAQAEKSRVRITNHGIWRCLTDDLREQAVADGVIEANYRSYRIEGWAGPYLVRTADHVRRLVEEVPW
jgi:hypothetical protein